MKEKIIQAIKNFDIGSLNEFLDDDKPYQDAPKSLFLERLEKKFNRAKQDNCHSFDDVFFGICGSCNKGCEGITFLSETGYYLDLFIESKNGIRVDDMYVCNMLTNFTDLEKINDLGFSFYKDEEVGFKESVEYLSMKIQYQSMLSELTQLPYQIALHELVDWINKYQGLEMEINSMNLFDRMDNKLYSHVFSLFSSLSNSILLEKRSEHAINALIDYHQYDNERDKVIWSFKNKEDEYNSIYFENKSTVNGKTFVNFSCSEFKFKIDITGFEYVLDYFIILCQLNDHLLDKYKPAKKYFDDAPHGRLEYSLENYLTINNIYLDVIEKFKG